MIYRQLGDDYSAAVTSSNIANILRKRGKVADAIRLLRDEALPTFERLGTIRDAALAIGGIAEALRALGDLSQSLLLLRERALPIFEDLGDLYAIAVTKVKIASILAAQGSLDAAIRIIGDDVLPVLDRLGAARVLMVSRVELAQYLQLRREAGDIIRASALLTLAFDTAHRLNLPEEGANRSYAPTLSNSTADRLCLTKVAFFNRLLYDWGSCPALSLTFKAGSSALPVSRPVSAFFLPGRIEAERACVTKLLAHIDFSFGDRSAQGVIRSYPYSPVN